MTKLLWMMVLVGCICQIACAADLFYSGDVGIDSIQADVDLQDTGSVTLVYTLSNGGGPAETVTVEYWNTSTPIYVGNTQIRNPVLFEAGERQSFVVKYTTEIPEGEPKLLTLDPTLLFDGKYHPRTTDEMVITVMLPKGVKTIISANKEYSSKGNAEEGRVRYEWRFQNDYPTPLTIKWTSLGIDLDVTKSVSPQAITERNRDLKIEITVQNRGEMGVDNLTLSDDFVPSHFEAIEPRSEFFTPDSNRSDPRVIWRKDLGDIKAGERKRVSYTVRYIGSLSQPYDLKLTPTAVFQKGTLVGISNAVRVSLAAPTATTGQEPPQKSTPFNVEVVVLAFTVVVVGYPFMRNR